MRASYRQVVLTVMIGVAALASRVSAAPAPVAWWTCEEIRDGKIADVSGHGHEATLAGREGKLPGLTAGLAGQALRLTAADEQYLQVANDADLRAPATFTIMAWIRPVGRGATYEIIGNKGDRDAKSPGTGWRLRYFWTRAVFEFASTQGTLETLSTPEWSVLPGHWSHVAASYDGSKLRLYVNAELLAERELAVAIAPATRAVVMGNYIGRKNAYAFDGLLDEVKVFATALSEDELFEEACRGMN